MSDRYKVSGYEEDRYTGGYRVYDSELGFFDGVIADLEGDSQQVRERANRLADLLNKTAGEDTAAPDDALAPSMN
jgi:hypothetical protein